MFEPGYYKVNYRAVRLREMVRWYGWPRGIRTWLRTRFMSPSRHGRWMPGLWAEYECEPEDLGQEFWQGTKPHRADFEKLGFVQCRLGRGTRKSDKISDPAVLNSGSIFYLDSSRCYFGQLLYSRHTNPSNGKITNNIVLAFTAVFERGSFSCTNRSPTFDSAHTGKVVRIDSYDVPVIYDRFRQELQKYSETPRSFPNLGSLRQWSDDLKVKSFEDRVRRGLFVRMTEPEVAASWADRQRHPAGPTPPLARRRFRLGLETTTFVIIGIIALITNLHEHRLRTDLPVSIPENSMTDKTIEYQGQQFKLSRSYAEYEDYKDDPNNLDTNELPRIERTMESVKVPATFKNLKAFINFMIFDLEFPGYGMGGIGTSVQTDDGSTFEAEFVEIPQVDKERIVVVQNESGGELKLVDDFIFDNNVTNFIGRVKLEHRQLEYFDTTGRLFRKKTI